MIYGPDCAKKALLLLVLLGITGGCFIGIERIALLDKTGNPEERLCRVSPISRALLCIICSECIAILMMHSLCFAGGSYVAIVLMCIIAACLLAAAVMDVETHMVYDYVWWIGWGAAVALLCLARSEQKVATGDVVWIKRLIELLNFIWLQELLFARMYGRADCHAFVVCAITGSAFGMGMKEYLLLMLFAFVLLAVVQLIRGNVGRDGNLKAPVAFLPYINISCLLSLICTCVL